MRSTPTLTLPTAVHPANDVGEARAEERPRDARIQRALEAMSARPSERWTVAKLAKVAAMSRATFARHFCAEVGEPPLQHLANLRIREAARLALSTTWPLASIAREVGYANEFALSRAFRRVLGQPPSVYRRTAAVPDVTRCLAA